MLTRHTHSGIVWIDLAHPTQNEVRALMEEFALDPLVADELITPSARNHVDAYGQYLYLVLHFPAFRHTHDMAGVSQEIDFIIGTSWIITTRYDTIDPLHKFSQVFEVDRVLDKHDMGTHGGIVFYYMLVELYRAQHDEVAYLGVRLDEAEERVFSGDEKKMVIELSQIGRDLLNFTQALASHGALLESLEKPGVKLFGYEYARHVRSLRGEHERLDGAIHELQASLRELRETNNALLTTKQNEVMRRFTIMAFLMLPLSVIASVFGMNIPDMPLLTGNPTDFWLVLSIMLTTVGILFIYFRHQRWL